MRIGNARDLGLYVRDQRRAAHLSQQDLAARSRVSRRWLSDLEAGKPTAEVGLIFKVVSALGIDVDLRPSPPPEMDLDDYLDNLGGAR